MHSVYSSALDYLLIESSFNNLLISIFSSLFAANRLVLTVVDPLWPTTDHFARFNIVMIFLGAFWPASVQSTIVKMWTKTEKSTAILKASDVKEP
jgi:hypothetical protein